MQQLCSDGMSGIQITSSYGTVQSFEHPLGSTVKAALQSGVLRRWLLLSTNYKGSICYYLYYKLQLCIFSLGLLSKCIKLIKYIMGTNYDEPTDKSRWGLGCITSNNRLDRCIISLKGTLHQPE